MKAHCTLCLLAACAAGLSSLAATNIESGVTVTITDATVADYAGGISFVDATGVVEFDTTSAPTMDITGAGTVKKTSSSSSWTMSKTLADFSGDYILSGGGVVTASGDSSGSGRYLFGNDTGALTILDGNTLYLPNTGSMPMFYKKLLKIAGTGYNSRGAIHTLFGYNTASEIFNNIKLLADATINYEGNYYQFMNGATIDMDGHVLTYTGQVALDMTGSSTYSTSGSVRLASDTANGPWFKIRNRWMDFGTSEDPFVIENYGGIAFYYDGNLLHDIYPFDRPLTVRGTHGWIGIEQQNQTSPCTYTNMDANVWKSKITLNEGSILDMKSKLLRQQFNVTGPITGKGSVRVGGATADNRYNLGRTYFANTNNTYEGFTYVNNSYVKGSSTFGQFLAAGPHSIPNYASLTGSYGVVSLRMKARESDEEVLWTDGNYIRDLANEGAWLNGCGIGFDTSFLGEAVTVNYPAGITNDTAYLGGSGPHDVTLTNVTGTSEHPFRLQQTGGKMTVRTKPGAPQVLGDVRVSTALWNPDGVRDSTVTFEDSDLILSQHGALSIGYAQPTYDKTTTAFDFKGTNTVMQLKNTRLIAENLANSWDEKTITEDAILVGSKTGGTGELEIYDGTVVTGRLVVSGCTWGGSGAVYQYGGSVTALGSANWNTTSQIGSGKSCNGGAQGNYELYGGEFVSAGHLSVGALMTGLYAQFGGTFRMTSRLGTTDRPQLGINVNNGGHTVNGIYIGGGTFDLGEVNADVTFNGRWSGSKFYAFMVAEGATTSVDLGTRTIAPNAVAAGSTDITVANGARFRTGGFRKGNADSEVLVNLNGGIWECALSRGGVAGGDDIFQIERTSYPGKAVDHVFLYKGGVTVDTAGKSNLGTYRVIEGAYGKGVTGLQDFEPFYVSLRPMVRITGDGKGAVAMAEWDRATGLVTGIRVIAPGAGYTEATATFYYRSDAGHATACTLADNENTGSFTKTGADDFYFAATNTYGGATIVKEGTLKGCCDWAFPTNTAIVLAGGDVDFGGKTGEVSSVTYKVGAGRILNAENVALPSTSICEISTAELAAGQSIALSGDVDLSKVTVRVTGDVSALAANGRYDVVTTTGAFTGTPTVELDSSFPSSWRTRVQATRIRLVQPTGIVEVLR